MVSIMGKSKAEVFDVDKVILKKYDRDYLK